MSGIPLDRKFAIGDHVAFIDDRAEPVYRSGIIIETPANSPQHIRAPLVPLGTFLVKLDNPVRTGLRTYSHMSVEPEKLFAHSATTNAAHANANANAMYGKQGNPTRSPPAVSRDSQARILADHRELGGLVGFTCECAICLTAPTPLAAPPAASRESKARILPAVSRESKARILAAMDEQLEENDLDREYLGSVSGARPRAFSRFAMPLEFSISSRCDEHGGHGFKSNCTICNPAPTQLAAPAPLADPYRAHAALLSQNVDYAAWSKAQEEKRRLKIERLKRELDRPIWDWDPEDASESELRVS